MIDLSRENERFGLRLTIRRMGRDLNVCLSGGDAPHIGAVAMAVPHPGLREPERTDASVSVLTVTGHREDGLARKLAHAFATQHNCTVCAACGIHLDDATPAEIESVLEMADALSEEAMGLLRE